MIVIQHCNCFFSGYTDEAIEKCYNLTAMELIENRECEMHPCPLYSWKTGNWSSCIPFNNMGTDMSNSCFL